MKTQFLILFYSLLTIQTFAQIGGGFLYGDKRDKSSYYSDFKGITATDSTFTLKTKVLLNEKANQFLLTLAIKQEGKTAKETLLTINGRIDKFVKKLKTLGISEKAVFVDFITQTPIYNYVIEDKIVKEYLEGFEVKKNIIISLNSHKK